jgi:hypothetical protein
MGFYRVSDVKNGEKKSFFVPCCLVPRFPPAPSPPRGVKGSLNSQFGFFGPDAGIGAGRCGAGLFAQIGELRSRSQWMGAWRGCESGTARASASGRGCARARSALTSVCKVSAANEHTRTPQAIGRAEQRSGDRIRAGACLSVASLRTTPGGASSARHPEGARPLARLFFGYFLLAKQKKVTRPTGRNRYSKPCLSFAYLFFGEAKKSKSANRPKPDLKKPID